MIGTLKRYSFLEGIKSLVISTVLSVLWSCENEARIVLETSRWGRFQSNLPRSAVNREWNPCRERSVLHSAKMRGVGELKNFHIRHRDPEFIAFPACFQICIGPVCPHYSLFLPFWISNVYPVPLYVESMWHVFIFSFYRGLQIREYMCLKRDFEHWPFKQCCHCDGEWELSKLDYMNFALWYDYNPMVPERRIWWFEWKCPP